jgi:hypothetical protein
VVVGPGEVVVVEVDEVVERGLVVVVVVAFDPWALSPLPEQAAHTTTKLMRTTTDTRRTGTRLGRRYRSPDAGWVVMSPPWQ